VIIFPLETARFGRSLFVCALLMAFPIHAALNLEGMTGYWMVPTAWTLPFNTLEGVVSHHKAPSKDSWNWIVGMGVLPHTEFVARYAMPVKGAGGDLSFNPKLGYDFFEGSNHPLGIAVGSQDIWGGARLMHANYLVATQRLGVLEATLGYGDGASQVVRFDNGNRSVKRLGGVFGGVEVDAPLPDSSPIQAALVHDYDATHHHTGARLSLREGAAMAHLSLVRDWSGREWEYAGGLSYGLPAARPSLARDTTRLVRLRLGPWLQSFMGTEVGTFDFQMALEMTGIVQPIPQLLGYARARDLLWYTHNFEPGYTFSAYRQTPQLWLEGGGVGWSPANSLSHGLWLQGGVADGSWQGGMGEASLALWRNGPLVGGAAGYWYSPEWHHGRKLFMPWIDWETRDRSWFTRLDVGRYWNQDQGFRARVGRRYGRLAPSMGFARTDGVMQMDGRLDVEFDGVGWHPLRQASVEPVPSWGLGYMTTVAEKNGDGNPLRPTLGKDPPVPLRGRYESWP